MTKFEKLNPPREDGFPIIKEIIPNYIFEVKRNNPDFDKPLSELEKEY